MNKIRFDPPAVPGDYARAIKYAEAQKAEVRSLRVKLDKAHRERDLAELQVRSLTHELQAARRELAELRSLASHPKGN